MGWEIRWPVEAKPVETKPCEDKTLWRQNRDKWLYKYMRLY